LFLQLGLLAPLTLAGGRTLQAGQRGLEQFTMPAPPCTEADLAPVVAPHVPFRPGAPERASLREAGVSGAPIVVSGFVIGLKCGPLKHVRVDFWQADASGRVDLPGMRLRGHQLTSGEGQFVVETILPGAAPGRARQLGVRVLPPGKPVFETTLFFPEDPLHARDAAFNPKLVMKKDPRRTGQAFTFDIILDM